MSEVVTRVVEAFGQVFGVEMEFTPLESFLSTTRN
jgi:hypothetical protein